MYSDVFQHALATFIILVLFMAGVAAVFYSLLWTFDRLERMEADKEVELLFLQRWDRCKSTELATWLLLKQELASKGQADGSAPTPTILIEAIDRRIAEARRRRAASRVIRLRSGHNIVTTTKTEECNVRF